MEASVDVSHEGSFGQHNFFLLLNGDRYKADSTCVQNISCKNTVYECCSSKINIVRIPWFLYSCTSFRTSIWEIAGNWRQAMKREILVHQ